MKHLLNTLYVTSPNRYLSLDGENIVISENQEEIGRVPLHNIDSVVSFGYTGASPALMGKCAESGIVITFLTPHGKFLARVTGEVYGNVALRKEQYRISENKIQSLCIAKWCISGKIYNSRWIIERAIRDYPLRLDVNKLKEKSLFLKKAMERIKDVDSASTLLGIEGEAASIYFSCFNDLILQQKDSFIFNGRSRKPPLDEVNAMLSFAYTLLAAMCTSALESVGLDPYIGFYHTDRPGRKSLALDMIEELRSVFADRFVLTLINKKIVNKNDFIHRENGSIIMTDKCRNTFLSHWQKKKQEIIKHPFLGEKVEWGMIPFVQAMLLARYMRGDIDAYPPFFWK